MYDKLRDAGCPVTSAKVAELMRVEWGHDFSRYAVRKFLKKQGFVYRA